MQETGRQAGGGQAAGGNRPCVLSIYAARLAGSCQVAPLQQAPPTMYGLLTCLKRRFSIDSVHPFDHPFDESEVLSCCGLLLSYLFAEGTCSCWRRWCRYWALAASCSSEEPTATPTPVPAVQAAQPTATAAPAPTGAPTPTPMMVESGPKRGGTIRMSIPADPTSVGPHWHALLR